ncbi:hypothetical protein JHK87_000782 [Glycine soja]|nr:hypothetical protein JHK87_000782 [Glycine soja]
MHGLYQLIASSFLFPQFFTCFFSRCDSVAFVLLSYICFSSAVWRLAEFAGFFSRSFPFVLQFSLVRCSLWLWGVKEIPSHIGINFVSAGVCFRKIDDYWLQFLDYLNKADNDVGTGLLASFCFLPFPVEFASCYGLPFLSTVEPMVRLDQENWKIEKPNGISKIPMAESLTCGTFAGFFGAFVVVPLHCATLPHSFVSSSVFWFVSVDCFFVSVPLALHLLLRSVPPDSSLSLCLLPPLKMIITVQTTLLCRCPMRNLGKVGVYCHIEIIVFPIYPMELMLFFLIGTGSYPYLTGNSLKSIMRLTTFLGTQKLHNIPGFSCLSVFPEEPLTSDHPKDEHNITNTVKQHASTSCSNTSSFLRFSYDNFKKVRPSIAMAYPSGWPWLSWQASNHGTGFLLKVILFMETSFHSTTGLVTIFGK